MSESITIARPYAKAIFEHARDKQALGEWSVILDELAAAAAHPQIVDFINNPQSLPNQQVELMMAVVEKHASVKQEIEHFISLLVQNKRLTLLPEINALYEHHRAEQEKTLSVDVIAYAELSPAQLQKLANSLSERLKRQVSLNTKIDTSIMGGAIVRAGDLVIDGSVRGKLNQLSSALTA